MNGETVARDMLNAADGWPVLAIALNGCDFNYCTNQPGLMGPMLSIVSAVAYCTPWDVSSMSWWQRLHFRYLMRRQQRVAIVGNIWWYK